MDDIDFSENHHDRHLLNTTSISIWLFYHEHHDVHVHWPVFYRNVNSHTHSSKSNEINKFVSAIVVPRHLSVAYPHALDINGHLMRAFTATSSSHLIIHAERIITRAINLLRISVICDCLTILLNVLWIFWIILWEQKYKKNWVRTIRWSRPKMPHRARPINKSHAKFATTTQKKTLHFVWHAACIHWIVNFASSRCRGSDQI